MNRLPPAETPAELPRGDGIHRFLVRYGPAGQVGWFGSVTPLPAPRGALLCVETELGRWLGECLQSVAADGASAVATGKASPTGEALRVATAADRQAAAASQEASGPLRTAAKDLLGRVAPELTLLDVSVSLCGRFGLLVFLGTGTPALGRLASELAERFGLQRVQWLAADSVSPRLLHTDAGPSPPGMPTAKSSAIPSEALPEGAVDWRLLGCAVGGADDLAVRTARRQREPLGLLGLYQQKLYQRSAVRWMLRVRAGCGGITPGQFRRLGEIACRWGDGTVRLTTRHGFQLHHVARDSAGPAVRQLEAVALSMRGSCGNAARNLMVCPLPPTNPAQRRVRQLATRLQQHLMPVSPAFDWVWSDPQEEPPEAYEPLYGAAYLPHKWKIALGTDRDNCVDVRCGDVGLVIREAAASSDPCEVDLYVGGSLAYRPGRSDSFAALALPLGRLSFGQVVPAVEALIGWFAEQPRLRSRPGRRFKYLAQASGVAGVLDAIAARAPQVAQSLRPAEPLALPAASEHRGWFAESPGEWSCAVAVIGGRLTLSGPEGEAWHRLVSRARSLCVAPRHGLVLTGVPSEGKAEVESLLRNSLGHRVLLDPSPSPVIACPARPTCPLALDDAESVRGKWQQAIDAACRRAGVERPPAAISGCPNGCSRPLTSAIGLVAHGEGKHQLHLGGGGDSLGRPIALIESPESLVETLAPLLAEAAGERRAGESLADGLTRIYGV